MAETASSRSGRTLIAEAQEDEQHEERLYMKEAEFERERAAMDAVAC